MLVDLDGTLIREDEVLDGARELLEHFCDPYVIVSNNSTHTASDLVRKLRSLDLKVEPERIVLAGSRRFDSSASITQMPASNSLPAGAVASVCRGAAKRSDTKSDTVARIGGEEFAILLPALWIRKLQARAWAGDYGQPSAELRAQRPLWNSPSFFEVAEARPSSSIASADTVMIICRLSVTRTGRGRDGTVYARQSRVAEP